MKAIPRSDGHIKIWFVTPTRCPRNQANGYCPGNPQRPAQQREKNGIRGRKDAVQLFQESGTQVIVRSTIVSASMSSLRNAERVRVLIPNGDTNEQEIKSKSAPSTSRTAVLWHGGLGSF